MPFARQPIFNEDRTVCNGEFFDYLEQKAELEAKGHIFRTHTDTEIIVHLYEERGEEVFDYLKGQFAFVLADFEHRIVLLARDRVGICPLHWSRGNDWLYFGSEVKALLASGAVPRAIDLRGLDHLFTFFAMPNRRTMFEGVQSIQPGHYLKITLRNDGGAAEIVERRYWDFDFPDAGDEDKPTNGSALIDEFVSTFRRAVEIRLRADLPVVGYLSGGVDSSYVLATASALRGKPLLSFTIGIPGRKYNETAQAHVAAQHIGSTPVLVDCDGSAIGKSYADLVMAADSPVLDTSCAALFSLAREVHRQGYKVALTGEGADEAFGGYMWFKLMELSRLLDVGSLRSTTLLGLLIRKAISPDISFAELARAESLVEGPQGHLVLYRLVAQAKRRYFNADLKRKIGEHAAYEELGLDRERMRRWHPMNRSLYLGYKVHLAGLLLNHKGDRVAMASSVETRYPFLDEDVIALTARLHPRWKLSRSFKDKILLRQAAARLLGVSTLTGWTLNSTLPIYYLQRRPRLWGLRLFLS